MVQKALIYVAKDDIDARNRISDIQKIIEDNTFTGLELRIKLAAWKKI